MSDLYIPIILGTGRPSRKTALVTNWLYEQTKVYQNLKTEIIDIADYQLNFTGQSVDKEKWQNLAEKADGFIIIAPEYNHSYPGELKLLLDLAYLQYNHKPLAICATSSGRMGGVRMVEQLRLVAIELKLIPLREAINFSNLGELFDQDGKMIMAEEKYQGTLEKLMTDLLWYAKIFKTAREEL